MRQIYTGESIQLAREIPELHLHKGTAGTVVQSWHYPTVAYEVEFNTSGHELQILLLEDEVLMLIDDQHADDPRA